MPDGARRRVLVVGCGGVGGFFGGRLALVHDVTFLSRRGKHLTALQTNGLNLDDLVNHEKLKILPQVVGDSQRPTAVFTDSLDATAKFDLMIVTPKLPDVDDTLLQSLKLHMDDKECVIMSLQNGCEATKHIASRLGDAVVGAACFISSFVDSPGRIKCVTADKSRMMTIGELRTSEAFKTSGSSESRRCLSLQAAFEKAGVVCVIAPDVEVTMWTKFVLASTYGIFSLTRLPFKVGCMVPETKELVEGAMRETVAVAAANGVHLDDETVPNYIKLLSGVDVSVKCSTLRDFEDGRPSEAEHLHGAVLRYARSADPPVPTPTHSVVYAMCLPREKKLRGELEYD